MAAVADLRVQVTESILGAGLIEKAVSGIGEAFGKVIDIGVSYNSMLEKTEGAYKQLFGSADAANEKIKEFQRFAASTPFELPGVLAMGRSLAQAGVEADNLVPSMEALGATIASTGNFSQEQVQGVTLAVTQMLNKGKVSAEEVNQLAERGINAWAILADHFGTSVAAIQKAAEKGQISGKDFFDAMNEAASAKGWDKLLGDMSKTWEGAMSTITDNAQAAIAQGFKPLFEEGRDALVGLAEFMSSPDFAAAVAGVGAAISTLVGIVRDDLAPALRNLVQNKALSDFAAQIGAWARQFVVGFTYVFREIGSTAVGIGRIFDDLTTGIAAAAQVVGQFLGGLGEAIGKVNKGDFKGAADAFHDSAVRGAQAAIILKDRLGDIGAAFEDAEAASRANALAAAYDGLAIQDAFDKAAGAVRAAADSAGTAGKKYIDMGAGMKAAADAAKKLKETVAPKGATGGGGKAGGGAAAAAEDPMAEFNRLLDEYVRGPRVGGLTQAEMQDRLRRMQEILNGGGALPAPAPAAPGTAAAGTAGAGVAYTFNAPVTFSEGPASGETWVAYMERMMVPIRAAASAQQAGRR